MLMRRSARKTATVILGQDAGDELPHLSFGDDTLLTGLESPGGEMASDLRCGEHERRRVLGVAAVESGEFADRPVLLAAIAVQGYEILERRLREAREQAPTAVRALSALIETYVAF